MRPLSALRRVHFDLLRYSPKTVTFIINTTAPKDLVTYRDSGDGWTVAEVVGHLLDCERLFIERAKLTMTRDNPVLPFPDQEEDVRNGHYNECDPRDTLAQWLQARADFIACLEATPDDGWDREGRPIKFPPFSLHDQLILASWHDQVHIEQMTRILTEKK